MEQRNEIIIAKADYLKISTLLASAPWEIRDLLQHELSRAHVIEEESAVPADVVTMNSTVTYRDKGTQKVYKVSVVFPGNADVAKNKISIFAPIGAALLGLRIGQTISWPVPSGRTKVIEVLSVSKS